MICKNIYLFTHADLDGAGCAVLLKRQDATVNIRFCNYETLDKTLTSFIDGIANLSSDDLLLITDICPSKDICERIDEEVTKKIKVQLLDHHKTRSWVAKYPWAKFNNGKCGTQLVEYWLDESDNVTHAFVAAVDAWDRWLLKSDHRTRGEELNTLCSFMGLDDFVNRFSKNLVLDQEEPFMTMLTYIEKSKKRYINKVIKDQLESARPHLDGYANTFKIFFATDYISEIGNDILAHPDGEDLKYVVIITPGSNRCSLRSREGEVDVSDIAKQFRGGGHASAAGFIIDFKRKITDQIGNMLNRMNY